MEDGSQSAPRMLPVQRTMERTDLRRVLLAFAQRARGEVDALIHTLEAETDPTTWESETWRHTLAGLQWGLQVYTELQTEAPSPSETA